MAENEFLREVEEVLNAALGNDSAGRPKGTFVLKEILERHGGTEIYLPQASELFIAKRNDAIKNDFRGGNYEEIAAAHGISARQVRRIVHGPRKKSRANGFVNRWK